MTERYIESTYDEVASLIMHFSQYDPEHGFELLEDLNQVHEIPEIGNKLFEEEKVEILKLIALLDQKTEYSDEEFALLLEAKNVLQELELKIAYVQGETRNKAKHTIEFNFSYLKSLSDDAVYQNSLIFSKSKVHELFLNKHGTRPGTLIFNSALDVLTSFYYYAMLAEDIDETTKSSMAPIIYDIAKNINDHACRYLRHKDPIFKPKPKLL